jgi:hypothetical protein
VTPILNINPEDIQTSFARSAFSIPPKLLKELDKKTRMVSLNECVRQKQPKKKGRPLFYQRPA